MPFFDYIMKACFMMSLSVFLGYDDEVSIRLSRDDTFRSFTVEDVESWYLTTDFSHFELSKFLYDLWIILWEVQSNRKLNVYSSWRHNSKQYFRILTSDQWRNHNMISNFLIIDSSCHDILRGNSCWRWIRDTSAKRHPTKYKGIWNHVITMYTTFRSQIANL